jgi:transposase
MNASQPARSRQVPRAFVHKPAGVIHPRVEAVGPQHFGIVAIDCAKARSRWMITDFFGKILLGPATVEHRADALRAAVEATRKAQIIHELHDLIVVVERTGKYHQIPKRAWAAAGFDVRVADPLATQRFRQPANPGDKTDDTDTAAIVRAAVNGFGLKEPPLPESFVRLRMVARHRRDLVEKLCALRCQIKEHMHTLWPGYADCFDDVFASEAALLLPRHFATPAAILEAGYPGLERVIREAGLRYRRLTLERILAWARTAAPGDEQPELRRRILLELDDDRRSKLAQVAASEGEMVKYLVLTEYLMLLSIPGINVVTAGDLAAEAGPISCYATARALTGRAGLYPSRYQSDRVDRKDGPLVRSGNRRLRQALLRIADTLLRCNGYYRAMGERWQSQGKSPRDIHVRIADRFSRLAYRLTAAREVYRHPSQGPRDYIIKKLMQFHEEHNIDTVETVSNLQAAAERLPRGARADEARPLIAEQAALPKRRGTGPQRLGEILPAVLAKLGGDIVESTLSGEMTPTN